MTTGIFLGGASGQWRVDAMQTVRGEPLATVPFIQSTSDDASGNAEGVRWRLRGVTSYERYTLATEKAYLLAHQPPLQRAEATSATLIPITKTAAWWNLAQDERRAILEDRSHHIAIGTRYFPQIARRLYHGRDLGEPFDFLTWFEYAPADATAFDDLIGKLRETEEWQYIEREIDIRLNVAAKG